MRLVVLLNVADFLTQYNTGIKTKTVVSFVAGLFVLLQVAEIVSRHEFMVKIKEERSKVNVR